VSELLELRGDAAVLQRYRSAYEDLRRSINSVCWDGEWYIRAFRDSGKPVGTSAHRQGKIFINAQTWSVISGLAPKERADAALASLKAHLARPKGIQICWPSYTDVEEDVGLISRCVPGKKENGAIFNHASSWAVLALLLNNDIDFACSVYARMLPLNAAQEIDRYEVEPYVFAEYVTSPDHPTEGQASHSWLTGTAVWMLRIGLDYILGLRTTLRGIVIDPHIPSDWKEYSVERRFRGKRIMMRVANPNGKNRGVASVTVNGTRVDGALLDPAQHEGDVLNVEVVMG
jgi:cellobiose phosphorylase